MLANRFSLCLFLLLISFLVKSQDGFYTAVVSMEQALMDPTSVKHIHIYDSEQDLQLLANNLARFTELKELTLSGKMSEASIDQLIDELPQCPSIQTIRFKFNGLKKPPGNLNKVVHLQHLEIKGNPNLDYENLFEDLSDRNIKQLVLSENKLEHLPKAIAGLSSLERIEIEGNSSLDFERVIKTLSEIESLESLRLPINQITEIPNNIALLENLKTLDLRDNILSDLSERIVSVRQLDSLSLEGNLIIDQADALSKIKGLDIKYLSLDEGLSALDRSRLAQLFPNAEIVEKRALSQQGIIFNHIYNDKKQSGTINLQKANLRPYSDAYLMYPLLFSSGLLTYDFDTSTFEQRYIDLNYINTNRRQPDVNYRYIKLKRHRKGIRGELWFDIVPNVATNRNNPEVRAFYGLSWVCVDELSKRAFRRKYVRRKWWDDIRIYYSDEEKSFVLELKHEKGFERLTAYPRVRNTEEPLERSQATYIRRNGRYTSALLRRKERFRQRLLSDKSRYDQLYTRKVDEQWERLRFHMSGEEQQMSQEDWLAYYDMIIHNEEVALENAAANSNYLIRSLEVSGYKVENASTGGNSTTTVNARFCDITERRVADEQVFLIDRKKKIVFQYRGTFGDGSLPMLLEPGTTYCIVVQHRNGDMYVMDEKKFEVTNWLNKDSVNFQLEKYSRKITTVGDIRKKLNI